MLINDDKLSTFISTAVSDRFRSEHFKETELFAFVFWSNRISSGIFCSCSHRTFGQICLLRLKQPVESEHSAVNSQRRSIYSTSLYNSSWGSGDNHSLQHLGRLFSNSQLNFGWCCLLCIMSLGRDCSIRLEVIGRQTQKGIRKFILSPSVSVSSVTSSDHNKHRWILTDINTFSHLHAGLTISSLTCSYSFTNLSVHFWYQRDGWDGEITAKRNHSSLNKVLKLDFMR